MSDLDDEELKATRLLNGSDKDVSSTEKEERKAIERCNQLTKPEHANWIGISNQKAIITILNLIQKQQEEIRLKREAIIEYQEWIIEKDKQLEKKDKIIDNMADFTVGALDDNTFNMICKKRNM